MNYFLREVRTSLKKKKKEKQKRDCGVRLHSLALWGLGLFCSLGSGTHQWWCHDVDQSLWEGPSQGLIQGEHWVC